MPLLCAGRLLKRWRYVGVYGPELSLCVGVVRVGPFRQTFWAVWDRPARQLHEHTALGRGGVELGQGQLVVRDQRIEIQLRLEENRGIEVVTPYERGYVWTRKQVGIRACGHIDLGRRRLEIDGPCFVDDWAGYPPRHTSWLWSAGLGTDVYERSVAWNLVTGINDAEHDSERTVWVNSQPEEVAPVAFAPDLSGVEFADGSGLRFQSEAVRRRRDNLLLIRSSYEQPFGRFSGWLPGGIELRDAYGVMERHDAVW